MLHRESFIWLLTVNGETMSIKETNTGEIQDGNQNNVQRAVSGSHNGRRHLCFLKNPSFLPASVHLLPSSPLRHPRLTIQQKHTNESLRKHVVQRISHVRQCSVQAQIMFVITAHQHPATREYLLRQMRLPIPNTHTLTHVPPPRTQTRAHTPQCG